MDSECARRDAFLTHLSGCESTLRAFSLDLTMPDFETELDGSGEDDDGPLFCGPQHGTLDEIVLGILNCAQSKSYRGIVTKPMGNSHAQLSDS